ncbi:site-specific DNA-cytosine methylase [Bradyrhizobium embrapense]
MNGFFFDPLPMFGFDLAVVDPPTEFTLYSANGNKKSASAQYDIMSWTDLAKLPVGHLIRANGIILLWACPPTLNKSMWLLEQWGALYKTELVWPKRRLGTGYRSRGMHDIAEPTPAITATGHVNLVEATPQYDILFRMLEPHELAAAMGFNEDEAEYEFAGTKTQKIKQIGNAVSVSLMKAEVAAIMADAAVKAKPEPAIVKRAASA